MTKTSEEVSIYIKFFISATLNMVVLILLVSLNLKNTPVMDSYYNSEWSSNLHILAGEYTDMNRNWYIQIGTSMIVVMIINTLMPHILDIVLKIPLTYLLRYFKSDSAILQADLNLLYEGKTFELWDRYAILFANIFFTLSFSSGIPILIPFLLAQFIIRYWVDKYLCK
jgi:hypothetical protein